MWTPADDLSIVALVSRLERADHHALAALVHESWTLTRLYNGEASAYTALRDAIRDVRTALWACAPVADTESPAWDLLTEWDEASGRVRERIDLHLLEVSP